MLSGESNKQAENVAPKDPEQVDPTQRMEPEFTVKDRLPLHRAAEYERYNVAEMIAGTEADLAPQAPDHHEGQDQDFLEKQKKPQPELPVRPLSRAEGKLPQSFKLEILQNSLDLLMKDKGGVDEKITECGKTLLHLAAEFGEITVASYLIAEKRANVNSTDREGNTPLLQAAFFGRKTIARYLLANGANVDMAANGGFTPLYVAIKNQDAEMASILITGKADVNLAAPGGFTPLYVAVENKNLDGAKLLLEAGADPTKSNDAGETPLLLATEISGMIPDIAIDLIHALHERDYIDERARLTHLLQSGLIQRGGASWETTNAMFSLVTNIVQSTNERAVSALQRLCEVGDFAKKEILHVKRQWDDHCEANGFEKDPALDVLEEGVEPQPNVAPIPAGDGATTIACAKENDLYL